MHVILFRQTTKVQYLYKIQIVVPSPRKCLCLVRGCPCTFPWQNLFRKIHGKQSIHGQATMSVVAVRRLTMQVID